MPNSKLIIQNSTESAYSGAINQFIQWGGYCPCKTRLIIKYVEEVGALDNPKRLKASTLKGHVAAFKFWHNNGGYSDPTESPTLRYVIDKIESLERQNDIHKDDSRFVTAEEGYELFNVLYGMTSTAKELRNRLINAISLMSGHRATMTAEIRIEHLINLGIEHSDIIIKTPAFKTKKEDPTLIPYTGNEFCPATWLREYVRVQNRTHGWLFPRNDKTPDKPLTRHTINTITKKALADAGIVGGKLTANSFRKTMATLSIMAGVDSIAVAAQGSWGSVQTINKHYASKAIVLQGDAPRAVIKSILDSAKRTQKTLSGEDSDFVIRKDGVEMKLSRQDAINLQRDITSYLNGTGNQEIIEMKNNYVNHD